MLVEEQSNQISKPTDETISRISTRHAMAHDALLKNKQHLHEALGQYLDVLFAGFADFRLTGPDRDPLDERVIHAIGEMKILRNQFLECVNLAAENERADELHKLIANFLGRMLVYKHAPRDVVHFNHLWCDHYRFLLRELFLGVIAVLIKQKKFDQVNDYLTAEYLFETDRGPQTANFLKFDSYIKSLDEFRARRLGLRRISVAADLQKERADLGFFGFTDVMQADFLLCVRGLLHYPQALTRWFPRTLVYAEQYEKDGFNIFFLAQTKKNFPAIRSLLQVKNRADLVRKFEQASQDCALKEWKFGGVPIPFESYMSL